MRLVRSALAFLLTAGVAVSTASAEELVTPTFQTSGGKAARDSARHTAKPAAKSAAKPGADRRPGELEGWDSKGMKVPAVAAKSKRPADAIGERAIPDGGLPLPERRFTDEPGMGKAPMAIDQNGNMGGAFRF